MRFNVRNKGLSKIAAKEAGRYAMHFLHLSLERVAGVEYAEGETATLAATDGRRLVCVPCEVDAEDVAGLIDLDAWAGALAEAKRRFGKDAGRAEIKCEAKALVLSNGARFMRPDGEFPRYAVIIPKGDAGTISFGVNATYLAEIQAALGGTCVYLTVHAKDRNRPYSVTVHDDGQQPGLGVVMPITIGKRLEPAPEEPERVSLVEGVRALLATLCAVRDSGLDPAEAITKEVADAIEKYQGLARL